MSFMQKILDTLKLESTREMEKQPESSAKYNDYYENITKQKENNLNISYDDVKIYDLKPFSLNEPFITDGHFIAIELTGSNLEKAYYYLHEVHKLLLPFKHLFKNAIFPEKIGTDYAFRDPKCNLPVSYLRLTPYTATMKESKYPFYLYLSYYSDYGFDYCYLIYFEQGGNIGKANLHLHGFKGKRLSYETKIRKNENGLYVMRINKTLYDEPYGTKAIYKYMDSVKKNRVKHMSQYELDQFAKECNAYIVREERRAQQERVLNGENNSE